MKVITFATWKSMDDFIAGKSADLEISEGWDGSPALCDRSAVQASKNARDVSAATAANAGSEADTERGALSPFFTNEMHAEHLYDPNQNAELLTAAEAPLGSVQGDIAHQAELQGARTRNASGFTKTLQEAARDKMKAAAGASEGIAAQDILGAKQLQQEGAAGMTNLFKTDTEKQLQAMGIESQDIKDQMEAGKSGWLQNLQSTLKTVQDLGTKMTTPSA